MCGIAGFIGSPNTDLLHKMNDLMKFRGPTDVGYLEDVNNGVNLAHSRLSILDNQGGKQPMWNEDFSICIVFNGEIYNHNELRIDLQKKGHIFKSHHSDTEVLIHGYKEWGHDLLEKINGMFAFCIYDKFKKILFFGRDRFGEKPLYYTIKDREIIFASDLRAVQLHPNSTQDIASLSIQKYFAYGYIPAPSTIYKNTYKLPGGCGMIFSISTGEEKIFTYWKFQVESCDELIDKPEEYLAEELLFHLTKATKLRMIADVPVGIFLSGGIDSSSIVACASKLNLTEKIKTFSIGFEDSGFDESKYARIVSQNFRTEHFEKYFNVNDAKILIDQVLFQLDEPMGDSSILPTYLLAKFAKEQVTVALGGDGADELFAGYAPFKALNIANKYVKIIPKGMRHLISCSINKLPSHDGYLSLDFKLKRILLGLEQQKNAWNPAWLGPLSPNEISELMHQPCSPEDVYGDAISAWEDSNAVDDIGKTSEFYAKFYLQDGILTKVDRSSMMVSLEVRSPFLDNNVVNFASKLPSKYKVKHGITKYLLKRSLRGILPREILDRNKRGFAMPLTKWLKEWNIEAGEAVGFDKEFVEKRLIKHNDGHADNRLFIWIWLVLKKYLDDNNLGLKRQ